MIIRGYLGAELVRSWMMVLVILTSLFGLLSLIEEIDNLSERYHFVHALSYVALTAPQRVLELSPVITALGTLLAFARLTRNSELIVLRCAGFSLPDLLWVCALPTLALLLFLGFSEEYYMASLYQRAETERQVRRSGNLDLLEGKGLWSNSGHGFFNVRNLRVGQIPEGISLYEFTPDGELLRSIDAESARLVGERHWKLVGVQRKEWVDGKVTSTTLPELELGPFWSAEELPVIGHSLVSMSPGALYQYTDYLRSTGQPFAEVRMAFWQKIALPISAAAMVLLSAVIGTAFGNTRSAAFGWRVFAGGVIGVGFYLLTQIIHTGGLLLGLDASVIVLVPIALSLLLAGGIAAATRGPR